MTYLDWHDIAAADLDVMLAVARAALSEAGRPDLAESTFISNGALAGFYPPADRRIVHRAAQIAYAAVGYGTRCFDCWSNPGTDRYRIVCDHDGSIPATRQAG